ncbi:C40 family peptidase [Corynebacterium uterequi]|nr:NlpC/P60 family protein [Corynebacterium uterequi]
MNKIARRAAAATAAFAAASTLTPAVASADTIDELIGMSSASNFFGGDVVEEMSSAAGFEAGVLPVADVAASANQIHTPKVSAPAAGQQVVSAARSRIGSPYVWGAAGPNAFDCSGLTSWAYAQAGKTIPRTSQAQAAQGQRVSLDALQPGDIVVYYAGASHVGIYVGSGRIIDAMNQGVPVQERDLHYMPAQYGVRF